MTGSGLAYPFVLNVFARPRAARVRSKSPHAQTLKPRGSLAYNSSEMSRSGYQDTLTAAY